MRSCKDFAGVLDVKRFADDNIALLSEHTHVLLYLYEHPESTVRELAKALEASERQTFRRLSELQQAGYLTRARQGRRNRYLLNIDSPMEEGQARGLTLAHFLAMLASDSPAADRSETAGADGLRAVRAT